MSIRLQVILLVLLIFILIGMVTQIKRKKLDLKYTLSWFALIIALIVLTCFPKLLIVIADFLGITTPINMIFFCGFCFSLIIIYTLTVAISKMSDNIRSLTQKIALLEKGETDHE
ncbi:MAG: DUF2304 domain-containing protein [Lachnospiraceae bacterium]|nr:DUF2304 domain-containing protein [Lachnospiraceae bacterium]